MVSWASGEMVQVLLKFADGEWHRTVLFRHFPAQWLPVHLSVLAAGNRHQRHKEHLEAGNHKFSTSWTSSARSANSRRDFPDVLLCAEPAEHRQLGCPWNHLPPVAGNDSSRAASSC